MPRAIWTGALSFGLVHIPVQLVNAVRPRSVSFHRLHAADGTRLRQKLYCPADGEEVSGDQIARGYEVGPDEYVIISDEELEALDPEKSQTLTIAEFVSLDDIDPLHFDRHYYLLPGSGATRPYGLLASALEQSRKVGLATFVMRNQEYLTAVRAVGGVICLEVMWFANEVVLPRDLEGAPETVEVNDRELQAAVQLIETMAGEFDPSRYHDTHQERVEELIRAKVEGREVVLPPPVPEREEGVYDLLSALEKSVSQAREHRSAAPAASDAPPRKRRKGAAG